MFGIDWTVVLIFGIIALSLRFFVLSKLSLSNNYLATRKWMEQFDCEKDGKRYQGSRSKIVKDFGPRKLGIGQYSFLYGCETISGRIFVIEIFTSYGLVVNWDLAPFNREELEI